MMNSKASDTKKVLIIISVVRLAIYSLFMLRHVPRKRVKLILGVAIECAGLLLKLLYWYNLDFDRLNNRRPGAP